LISLALNFIWVLGITSIFKVEKDLKTIYHSNLTDTIGFEMLMIFFNLSSIIMTALVTLGIACQLNLESALAELYSIFDNKSLWGSRFGSDMTLDSMI